MGRPSGSPHEPREAKLFFLISLFSFDKSEATEGFLVLKHPLVFGIIFVVLIGLQVGASYMSIRSFLKGDYLSGLAFFVSVPLLGLLMGLYYVWFRKFRSPHGPSGL